MRYFLTAEAEQQFADILLNLEEHSSLERALRIEEQLYAGFRKIAADPGIGHLRRDLTNQDVYFYYIEPYLVLYLRDPEVIPVVAIFHSARDIAALLRDYPL